MELISQIKAMRSFIKDTHWMARRYADGRSTYAPSMFNEALLWLKKAGLGDLVEKVGCDPEYARDGMYGEWNPERRVFKGVPPEEKDMMHHIHAAAAERDKKNLPRWVNKKTGKVYHVITMAENATNGPQEGEKMVVYFDELRVFVREEKEFFEKFQKEESADA